MVSGMVHPANWSYLFIFPIQNFYNTKNEGKSIIYYNTIQIEDRKNDTICLNLLYYYKRILYVVLANVFTPLKIVNRIATIT